MLPRKLTQRRKLELIQQRKVALMRPKRLVPKLEKMKLSQQKKIQIKIKVIRRAKAASGPGSPENLPCPLVMQLQRRKQLLKRHQNKKPLTLHQNRPPMLLQRKRKMRHQRKPKMARIKRNLLLLLTQKAVMKRRPLRKQRKMTLKRMTRMKVIQIRNKIKKMMTKTVSSKCQMSPSYRPCQKIWESTHTYPLLAI